MWSVHMFYMLRIKFDYGWNMQLCVTLGLLQALLWISWSQLSRHPARCTITLSMLHVHLLVIVQWGGSCTQSTLLAAEAYC